MEWFRVMWSRPDDPMTPLARYTQWNGVLYLVIGAAFYAVPQVGALFAERPLQGQEIGLGRLLGMTIAIIGWFYVFGARTNRDSFGLSTVADRVVLPFLMLPIVLMGEVDLALVAPLAVLDPLLGVGALLIWRRTRTATA